LLSYLGELKNLISKSDNSKNQTDNKNSSLHQSSKKKSAPIDQMLELGESQTKAVAIGQFYQIERLYCRIYQ
jgi:hypothetical protein